jgi:cell wall-associated NlpC family hydrolase
LETGVEWPADRERVDRVLNHALALLGTPYRLGGDEPRTGLDCSGLVRYVFGQSGVALPRTVALQFDVGRHVDRDALRAGDLIFFDTTDPGPSHVAIAIDAVSFVHAPGSGSVVRVDRVTAPYWRSRVRGVKRVSLSRSSLMAP